MKKTPVAVIGFVRRDVLDETLRHLAEAETVLDRDIFVYLSAPRHAEEKIKTDAVLELVRQYQAASLPNIIIIQRDKNEGAGKNISFAISETLKKTGRAIIIEDDILVSKTFLRYMDEALEYYADDKRIWCVNGYQNAHLKMPKSYPYDVYFNPRNMAWGWGCWRDRWDAVDQDVRDWAEFKKDAKKMARLNEAGCDMAGMLESAFRHGIDTWDVQCSYHMVKNGLYAVEPRRSLTKNNGFCRVGSVHCSRPHGMYQKQKYYNDSPRLQPLDVCLPKQTAISCQFRDTVHESRRLRFYWRCVMRVLRWLIGPQNNNPCD